jgi:hypothetical protein
MREVCMPMANLSRRTVLMGSAAFSTTKAAPAAAAATIAELDRRLTVLIGRCDVASADQERVSQRTYPDGRKPDPWPGESDLDHFNRLCAHEDATGFSAACEALDVAYERVYDLTDEILALRSMAPDALALKLRACLWDTPLKTLRFQGFDHVASLLEQLTVCRLLR